MNDTNEEILAELGIEVEAKRKAALSPKEERIIAGFEDIQRYVEENGHLPTHGADKDIFERLYAIRLEQIRRQSDCVDLLREIDYQDLLKGSDAEESQRLENLDDDELLGELGIDLETSKDGDITALKHVRSPAEIKAAEEIANRTACEDFYLFKPIFEALSEEIKNGIRHVRPFKDDASVSQGNVFILNGQKLYIAEKGETFTNDYGRLDSRLRVIYDNKTESNILMRTLTRALNRDENGRRITDSEAGPLFASEADENDISSGTIYVCRSLCEDPYIQEHRNAIHKIGVTRTTLDRRFANAEMDPTFLMAKVELVSKYELYNINCRKLEALLHRFFSDARLKIEIKDRFGNIISPKEWFLVSDFIIDEAVNLIKENKISDFLYDHASSSIIPRN